MRASLRKGVIVIVPDKGKTHKFNQLMCLKKGSEASATFLAVRLFNGCKTSSDSQKYFVYLFDRYSQ